MPDTLTSRISRVSPAALDALLAVGLTVLAWLSLVLPPVMFFTRGGGGLRLGEARPLPPRSEGFFIRFPHPEPGAISYALVALAFLPLALRRRFPLPVLAVTTLAAAAYQEFPGPPSLVWLAPLIALYTVGSLRDRRTLFIAGTLCAVVLLAVSLPGWGDVTFWAEWLRIVSMVGVAGALGDATRNRRAYIAEVEQRAAYAERTRDEEARRRVYEERLRIARELHDVTAHSLSIIAVQSGAAAHVLDRDPAEARRSLEAIRRTSKEALDELRAMLGVLRAEDEAEAPLVPVPGLARLGDLVAPLLEAGYEVRTDVAADLSDLPAVVDSSAYRIVQEALTNVVRHAGICNVGISVRRTDDMLVLTIDDDGRGARGTAVSEGHGLAGMRERVIALGGSFEAEPRETGGFHVGARLPLGSRSTS